ncbi:division/cell wall cluster transcriptional repressor MraZ [Mycoplasmopsis pulmonis]|uniref:division/cell wall cluster transcriptional repressor MraZ n=1 Tax=Mycoplasmopsis pulmonis TaxID=2107 RepID=UPI002ACE7D60|nr:division/cell wall cluster transcriptional repressor MraZ [Mycoplasmopsis pulmonis]MDZ7293496.1 division/cell wall cluster transcriptional repressor MraZ [Mycoplasmopsis pulmonis]
MEESGVKMALYGNFERSLDPKNRLSLPAKFKTELGSNFYLSVLLDGVVEIRNSEEFENEAHKFKTMNVLDKNARDFARLFFQRTVEVEADKQGRFVLPKHILEKASIQKDVVLVGMGDKVELWSKAKYDNFQDSIDDEKIENIAFKLKESGVEF